MVNSATKEEIKPNASYSVGEVANLLDLHPETVRNKATAMNAKKIGKAWRFLGENVLRYLGSATYNEPDYPTNPSSEGAAVEK